MITYGGLVAVSCLLIVATVIILYALYRRNFDPYSAVYVGGYDG